MDRPKRTHAAAISSSALRFSRLYGTWAHTGAETSLRSSAIHSASTSCQAGWLDSDGAQLSLPDQVVVDRERLLQRGGRVGEVRVVEVDAVGAQPAQALFDLPDDVAAGQPRVRLEAALSGLGGKHHLVAATGEGAAEDL